MDNNSYSFNSNSKNQYEDKGKIFDSETEGDFKNNIEGRSINNADNSNSLFAINNQEKSNQEKSNSTSFNSKNSNIEENNYNSIHELLKNYNNNLQIKYK